MSDLETRLELGPPAPIHLEDDRRLLAAVDALNTAYGFPAAFGALLPTLLAAAASEGELFEKLDRVADECRELAATLRPSNFTGDDLAEADDDDLPF